MQESEIISRFFNTIAKPGALENDAYILGDLAISKDIIVENTHFLTQSNPKDIAKKALRVNLSDIAAVGAKPIGYFLGVNLNERARNQYWLQEFTRGLKEDQLQYKMELFGGDTICHNNEAIVVSITIIGRVVGGFLSRSGAKQKDLICVSGPIGDAYFGLKSCKGEIEQNLYFEQKYNLPDPQLELGQRLVGFASSAIDLSDGLVTSIKHLEEQSNVRIDIDFSKIPISKDAQEIIKSNPEVLQEVVNWGDDYQLLFTISEKNLAESGIQEHHKIIVIGRVA